MQTNDARVNVAVFEAHGELVPRQNLAMGLVLASLKHEHVTGFAPGRELASVKDVVEETESRLQR